MGVKGTTEGVTCMVVNHLPGPYLKLSYLGHICSVPDVTIVIVAADFGALHLGVSRMPLQFATAIEDAGSRLSAFSQSATASFRELSTR